MSWISRHSAALAVLLTLFASVRIVATYTVFSHVTDEPAHIACGMEWLDRGTYTYGEENPPLARVAAAIGPYLAGVRSQGQTEMSREGVAVLAHGGRYDRNLSLARLGTLPFLWLAAAVVWLWSKHTFGGSVALLATLCFTNLPPVLAHAALATTDIALTALLSATLLMTFLWVQSPTVRRSLFTGALGGLAVLSKFSCMAFFLAALAAIAVWLLLARPSRARLLRRVHLFTALLALTVALGTVWAGYRFSFGRVRNTNRVRPAPEFFTGLKTVRWHNRTGHLSYLLGRFSQKGFHQYYPIALGVKTPLPFLLLLMWGGTVSVRRWRRCQYALPLASALGILTFAVIYSQINIGVRHILPVYIGFSIVAGIGARALLRTRWTALILASLLGWLIAAGLWAHPDYLAYFNELVIGPPEDVLIDSDLDWGQDDKRLARRLQELKATEVSFLPGSWLTEPRVTPFSLTRPAPGWNAAHITPLKIKQYEIGRGTQMKLWTEENTPVERIGRGVLLWYIADQSREKPTGSGGG